jgi:hypothetical protein
MRGRDSRHSAPNVADANGRLNSGRLLEQSSGHAVQLGKGIAAAPLGARFVLAAVRFDAPVNTPLATTHCHFG